MISATGPSALDLVNRAAWSSRRAVNEFGALGAPGNLDCWTDPGEQAALSSIAPAVRNGRILDVGVGGGRTTTLLTLLSDDYVAIDYTPEMVEACQRNHPEADVRLGDVRDLFQFEDGSFDLVVFSFNGLDAISHPERQRALAEMARVLATGGFLLFSTHNKCGPCYGATPLRRAGSPLAHTWSPQFRYGMAAKRAVSAPVELPRAIRNHRRLAAARIDEPLWGIGPLEAYDFGLLIHYTTLRGAGDELAAAGLRLEAVFDAEYGRALDPNVESTTARYFHLIARKVGVQSDAY